MFAGTVLLLAVAAGSVVPSQAEAKVAAGCKNSVLGLPSWYEYLEVGPQTITTKTGQITDDCALLPIPPDKNFDWGRALPRIGLAVIDIMLRLGALIAVGFTIYGGFRYMLSQGEPEATKKAKGTIVGASVGVVITLFAATIVSFIGSILWTK